MTEKRKQLTPNIKKLTKGIPMGDKAIETTELETWNIHSTEYTVKAELRQLLLQSGLCEYHEYAEAVGGITGAAGYKGWYDLEGFGAVCYKREDDTIQYDW